MNRLPTRIVVAAAILAVMAIAIGLVRRGAWTESPNVNPALQKLPANVGGWTLEEKDVNEVFLDPPTDAASTIVGMYRNSAGVRVPVEMDMFTLLDVSLPHPPEQCYNLSGDHVLAFRDIPLPLAGGRTVNVRLMTVDRNGQRLNVLFWYNLDQEVVVDRMGLGQVRLKLHSQRRRPLVVKILMQLTSASSAEAEEHLRSLAAPLAAWISGLSG